MTAEDRVERYVRRYFARRQEFPTVRRVAKSLRLPQEMVEEAAGNVPMMLTAYNTEPPEKLGDHFVEICE